MKTDRLERLYQCYGISDLEFGEIHDKLGDVYEDYCKSVLEDQALLQQLKDSPTQCNQDAYLLFSILTCFGISDFNSIKCIKATRDVPTRASGGNPKSDVIAYIEYINGTEKSYPISCKQSTVAHVAMAEFDVDTICREMNITDSRLRGLLLKHQVDRSAKYFTSDQKSKLRELMAPIARDFVRWVVSGTRFPNPSELQYPVCFLKFKLVKPRDKYNFDVSAGDFDLIDFHAYTIEQYIDCIMYKNGRRKTGGFGTGLSWTYATGSAGHKIQFKA